MGLSAYGNPNKFKSIFDNVVKLFPNGMYSIDELSRPDLLPWLETNFGKIPQKGEFSQRSADIAAALQKKLEETVLYMLSFLKKEYSLDNLCISGGVGLNACLNSHILFSKLFRRVYFQPASADDGTSLGVALYVLYDKLNSHLNESIRHVYWGPYYCSDKIETVLKKHGMGWEKKVEIEKAAAKLLSQGKILGWFQGRMEMGPRALGARSILASPQSIELRDKINSSVKNRERFRPLCPSVIEEEAKKFFNIPKNTTSPFMLITFQTHIPIRKLIPGVVHIDGTSRIQTVSEKDNPRYYNLLRYFYELTGIPMLLNTSFNRAGEPIVSRPDDAIKCFLKCGLDALVIEDYLILSSETVMKQ